LSFGSFYRFDPARPLPAHRRCARAGALAGRAMAFAMATSSSLSVDGLSRIADTINRDFLRGRRGTQRSAQAFQLLIGAAMNQSARDGGPI
jgi:hypothetical protein